MVIKNFLWMLAVLFGLVLFAAVVLPPRAAEESAPQPSPYDQHLVELDRAALDEAYRMQLAKLFGVWMADDHGQPARAITGANRARRAYIAVMHEIEQREAKGSR
jgi:hypothetical protein